MPGFQVGADAAAAYERGAGTWLRHTAQRLVRGAGIGPGAVMLASTHANGGPGDAPVRWVEASADAMPLEDASFDVALCQQGLEYVPDAAAALREIHRVLAPGGLLRLNVWSAVTDSRYLAAVGDAIARFDDAATLSSYEGAYRDGQHAFATHVAQLLEPYAEGETLRVPFSVLVAKGRRPA